MQGDGTAYSNTQALSIKQDPNSYFVRIKRSLKRDMKGERQVMCELSEGERLGLSKLGQL